MPETPALKQLHLKFDNQSTEKSAEEIVYALFPEWKRDGSGLKFKTFTEGITNTMLRITHDDTSLVLRAFGPGAEPLTSRPREIATHGLFASYGLAPSLLARFKNGLIYHFTPGSPCSPETLSEERVWRGVARTLGRWHAVLPIGAEGATLDAGKTHAGVPSSGQGTNAKTDAEVVSKIKQEAAPGDMWAVMRLWASRIPEEGEEGQDVKRRMVDEVESAFAELSGEEGLGAQKLVMGHCDLLAGNVLVQDPGDTNEVAEIQLIDYEYSVACNAAFDIALHFGEWPGFDCDYNKTPSPQVRKKFAEEYVRSWRHERAESGKIESSSEEQDISRIYELVDRFRHLPGLWFGLWGLVQAHDSSEEFDYRKYAKMRLGEYWAGKGVDPPMDVGEGQADPALRESKWFGRA
ncbi:MAG: hypothetical protein M1821_000633 [Bathelium mastoideum]|nr:MAG: hypothetical protein M1821_000633 [Bathelium mastoideum]